MELACAPPIEGWAVAGPVRDVHGRATRPFRRRPGAGKQLMGECLHEHGSRHTSRGTLAQIPGTVKAELRKFGKEIVAANFALLRRLFDQRHRRRPLGLDLETALRTADPVHPVEQELAAQRALQAGASEDRDQLLVERPVQSDNRHSERNTPITLPRIWTCAARIGS